jgi:hypothetical protein
MNLSAPSLMGVMIGRGRNRLLVPAAILNTSFLIG